MTNLQQSPPPIQPTRIPGGSFGHTRFWRFTANGRQTIRFGHAAIDRVSDTVADCTVPILDVEFFGRVASSCVNEVMALESRCSLIDIGTSEAGISGGLTCRVWTTP